MANTNVKMLHVPFKGGVPSLAALLGGQVDAIFNPVANILPSIRGGKAQPLAVTSPQRTPELPDVPTLAESGLPQGTVTTWLGLYSPAGIPPAIIDRLNADTKRIVQRPEVQERFVTAGLTAKGSTLAALGDNLKFEIARWTKLINNAGIKLNCFWVSPMPTMPVSVCRRTIRISIAGR